MDEAALANCIKTASDDRCQFCEAPVVVLGADKQWYVGCGTLTFNGTFFRPTLTAISPPAAESLRR